LWQGGEGGEGTGTEKTGRGKEKGREVRREGKGERGNLLHHSMGIDALVVMHLLSESAFWSGIYKKS